MSSKTLKYPELRVFEQVVQAHLLPSIRVFKSENHHLCEVEKSHLVIALPLPRQDDTDHHPLTGSAGSVHPVHVVSAGAVPLV